MERSFRLVFHPSGTTPQTHADGFAVGDWSPGGYLAVSAPLPDLGHAGVDLASQWASDSAELAGNLPTSPGSPPVSPFWPARGVYYGGMTGGVDIEQVPGVRLAVTGQPEGLLSLDCEQLRYASRQLGCIYTPSGDPIELDDFLNPDGTRPWDLFNNKFQGTPPDDEPFDFADTGPGSGSASYDPLAFAPIDRQHFIRRSKANQALAWLENDPLAKLYLFMDTELGRMDMYEGPGGGFSVPAPGGLGTTMGRADAWLAELMATCYALGDDAWRARNAAWIRTFVIALAVAQMPSGLVSCIGEGSKVAENPPYGDGTTAFYYAFTTNEEIFLELALRALRMSTGLDTSELEATIGQAIWSYAWKSGEDGPLDRYPAGPIGTNIRWASPLQFPAGLVDGAGKDSYHVGGWLAWSAYVGADVVPALYAFTGTTSLEAALDAFEDAGTSNIENRAPTLAILQQLFR
jgi:hypothetical protein